MSSKQVFPVRDYKGTHFYRQLADGMVCFTNIVPSHRFKWPSSAKGLTSDGLVKGYIPPRRHPRYRPLGYRDGIAIYAVLLVQASHYVQETGGSPYQAMLLNNVVMGKAIKLMADSPSLKQV